MISRRAQHCIAFPAMCNMQDALYETDPYHPVDNPTGYVKLSFADNYLCADLVAARFRRIDWARFDAESVLGYPRPGGEFSTLKALASFVNEQCPRGDAKRVDAEELVLVAGVSTCIDLLSHTLFDPGDYALLLGPNYHRFSNDLGERGEVKLGIVSTHFEDSTDGRGELRLVEFERVYAEITNRGGKVKALILTNPTNPEGTYYTLPQLKPIVKWALGRGLFVVLDEIYDLAVYDPQPEEPFHGSPAVA